MANTSQPRRLADNKSVRNLVGDHLESMIQFVEHRRTGGAHGTVEGSRKIVQCAVVVQWQEADGSEYVTVAGDEELTELGIKGMLHDGIYAMAHLEDPEYSIQSTPSDA
ncbi:MAG: hypothetical protein QOG54_397 [Actinomycetota bacterium]|nr:hypothetical protein [Actinomycetota bacterium]